MRLPSVRTLESAFPGKGRELRKLLESAAAVRNHPAAIKRMDECFHTPSLHDLRLHALNSEAGTFGIEYIAHRDDGYCADDQYGIEYLNAGDTYAATLLFDHHKQTWRVCGCGDIVEARPNHYI